MSSFMLSPFCAIYLTLSLSPNICGKFKSECFQGFAAHHVHFFLIPTRSRQAYSKQVCLWDLAQIICIAFIIQVAWAI